jgi:hypothetical protein
MSSANRDILTVSLPICIPFIPSSCLIALARNSSTMLNRSGDTSQSLGIIILDSHHLLKSTLCNIGSLLRNIQEAIYFHSA